MTLEPLEREAHRRLLDIEATGSRADSLGMGNGAENFEQIQVDPIVQGGIWSARLGGHDRASCMNAQV
ncbi:MAG: hypothetical protein WCE20_07870 [Rhizomicrobium sp.]